MHTRSRVGRHLRVLSMSFCHATNRTLLIKPRHFGYNEETAESCGFQEAPGESTNLSKIAEDAQKEFGKLTSLLESCGIQVNEEQDRTDKQLPNSVFPNNWLSFHSRGGKEGGPTVVVYPMMSELRRQERQESIVRKWQQKLNAELIDLSEHENNGLYLEGTGSMVLDRANSIVYACLSPRTTRSLIEVFCSTLGYKQSVIFDASMLTSGGTFLPIYHTNVMMSVAEKFALICLDSIRNDQEREHVKETLEKSGKQIIPITEHQMNDFAGNALQLRGRDDKRYLVMSTRAHNALEEWQKSQIRESSEIIHSPIDVIERLGGGSVRCMITEVFPPM